MRARLRFASAVPPSAQLRARLLQEHLVDGALVLVHRLGDAVDLFNGQNIGAHALFDLAEPVVVGLFESVEGFHEIVKCASHVVGVLRR